MRNLDTSLNWEIQQLPIFDTSGNQIEGYKQIINDSTGEVLHVCKETFTPTRNEVLTETAHSLCQSGNFEIEGFATFKGGTKVMAYLKSKEAPQMLGLAVSNYLVLGNGHDGTSSFFTGLTNQVYRCQNMFSSTNKQFRVTHTSGHDARVKGASETIELFYNQQTGFYEQMQDFASHQTSPTQKEDFANYVLDIKPNAEISSRKENIKDRFLESINRETADLGNNLFGLFNGATHYTSHVLNQKNPVFGNPFGHANTLNRKALEYCLAEQEHGQPSRKTIFIPAPKTEILSF